jgi:hypothetical protein
MFWMKIGKKNISGRALGQNGFGSAKKFWPQNIMLRLAKATT